MQPCDQTTTTQQRLPCRSLPQRCWPGGSSSRTWTPHLRVWLHSIASLPPDHPNQRRSTPSLRHRPPVSRPPRVAGLPLCVLVLFAFVVRFDSSFCTKRGSVPLLLLLLLSVLSSVRPSALSCGGWSGCKLAWLVATARRLPADWLISGPLAAERRDCTALHCATVPSACAVVVALRCVLPPPRRTVA